MTELNETEASENPLLAEGDIAADYLEELLDIADLDGDIENYFESGRAYVSVDTGSDLLVGRDGEVLEALQALTRLAVLSETGHRSRLMLDIAGYRDRRRQELTAQAKDAIAEVTESGEATRLQAMNAFERKIVHDAVAAAPGSCRSQRVKSRPDAWWFYPRAKPSVFNQAIQGVRRLFASLYLLFRLGVLLRVAGSPGHIGL